MVQINKLKKKKKPKPHLQPVIYHYRKLYILLQSIIYFQMILQLTCIYFIPSFYSLKVSLLWSGQTRSLSPLLSHLHPCHRMLLSSLQDCCHRSRCHHHCKMVIEFGVSSSGLYYSIWVGRSGDGVKKVDLVVGGVQEADSALGCIEDAICNEVVEETSQSDSTSSSSSSS